MKLSFSTLGCPNWDIEQIAENAAKYGYDGVELRSADDGHVSVHMTYDERKIVKREFDDRGVEICCLSCYSNFSSKCEDDLLQSKNVLLQSVDLANDLNARYIRAFIGNVDEGITEDDVIKNTVEYLKPCCEYASTKDVHILIETHDYFITGEKVIKILEAINLINGIGVVWDIHHTIMSNEKPEETIEILGDFIKHVHIKDTNGTKECLPGEGILDINKVVSLLKNKNYSGYYSFEWERRWKDYLEEPEVAFPWYVRHMSNVDN